MPFLRRLIVALSLVGVYVSYRALQIHYSTESAPCSINDVWDCGIVNHSKFAVFHGVPVALIGIIGYVLLGLLAMLGRVRIMTAAAVIGLAFSLYLANIEKTVLGVWCQYCVASLITISLITLLALIVLLFPQRDRRPASQR